LLGGTALTWSVCARAQQPANVPRIGILSDETPSLAAKAFEPLARGLRDLGWVEGQNITFERRYAEGENKILPSLAAGLVALHPEVIVAVGTPAARAAKIATEKIPIVFARIADPIGSGLVPALGRPGGNLTGVTSLSRELAAKRLELLTTAVPGCQTHRRPLGSQFSARPAPTYGNRGSGSNLEPGASASGGARLRGVSAGHPKDGRTTCGRYDCASRRGF